MLEQRPLKLLKQLPGDVPVVDALCWSTPHAIDKLLPAERFAWLVEGMQLPLIIYGQGCQAGLHVHIFLQALSLCDRVIDTVDAELQEVVQDVE